MSRREHPRAELHLSGDEQMTAAIGGAVAHFGQQAGLDEAESEALAASLEEFCKQTQSSSQGESCTLRVLIEDFEDRIEIVIEHSGPRQPTAEVEPRRATTSHQASGRMAGVEVVRILDRSEIIFDGGRKGFRTRMVRYLSPRA